MGDFWGLSFTEEEKRLGVSVALVNTEKGDKLLKAAADRLFIEEKSFKGAVDGNPMLLQSVKSNSAREEFFQRIQTEPYSKVVWSILGSNMVKRFYQSTRSAVKAAAMKLASNIGERR